MNEENQMKIEEIRLWLEAGKLILRDCIDIYYEVEEHLERRIQEFEENRDEQRGS